MPVRCSAFEPLFTTKPMGDGTTFTVVLPYAPQNPNISSPETGTAPENGSVLLVDDEPALARAVAQSLERRGYQVTTSHDGRDALRLLDEGLVHPDIALSDVAMPNLSGDRLAEELAARYPQIPVILMTDFSRDVHPDGQRGSTVVEILQKPMSTRLLSDLVARILAR